MLTFHPLFSSGFLGFAFDPLLYINAVNVMTFNTLVSITNAHTRFAVCAWIAGQNLGPCQRWFWLSSSSGTSTLHGELVQFAN